MQVISDGCGAKRCLGELSGVPIARIARAPYPPSISMASALAIRSSGVDGRLARGTAC